MSSKTLTHTTIFECVKRRDGTNVWRSMHHLGGISKIGGARWIDHHNLDAREYEPGARVRVVRTTTVEML